MAIAIESRMQGDVPLKVAYPGDKARGAVIVLHQANGYAPQTADWLVRVAEAGYIGVAPVLYHRRGVEEINPLEFEDMEAFDLAIPTDDDVRSDLAAAFEFLRSEGVDAASTGVLGFSFGGRAALVAALDQPLAAAVSYYGNGVMVKSYFGNTGIPSLNDRVPSITTPWLGLYGADDFLLGPSELDDLEAAIASASVDAALVRYPGAGHAFDLDSFMPGMPSPLVPEAAEDAQARTLAFFEKHIP